MREDNNNKITADMNKQTTKITHPGNCLLALSLSLPLWPSFGACIRARRDSGRAGKSEKRYSEIREKESETDCMHACIVKCVYAPVNNMHFCSPLRCECHITWDADTLAIAGGNITTMRAESKKQNRQTTETDTKKRQNKTKATAKSRTIKCVRPKWKKRKKKNIIIS